MLKVRVIPTLLFKNFGLVKGAKFDNWRRTGSVMQTMKVYNLREVDEMLFLDITATHEKRPPDFANIDEIADDCFVPLGVGGGVTTVENVRHLLQVGADKVVIGTIAAEHPKLISQVANQFGAQCVVVAIDVKETTPGKYEVYTHSGAIPTGRNPIEFAKEVERLGAGEIVVTSINRDGTMEGYDVKLTKQISSTVRTPVIASGGAGSYAHMVEVIKEGGASAVAAASMFHFTEQTPLEAKRYLAKQGIAVRL